MSSKTDYGSAKYWNERYSKQRDVTFDWIDSFPELEPIFHQHILEPLYANYMKEESKRQEERRAQGEMTLQSQAKPNAARENFTMPPTRMTTVVNTAGERGDGARTPQEASIDVFNARLIETAEESKDETKSYLKMAEDGKLSALREEFNERCQTVVSQDERSQAPSEPSISSIFSTLRILNVGCGNSQLAEQMYDAGFRHIVNIDISPVAIEMMQKRNEQRRPTLVWQVMDVTNLEFEAELFDVVIDKSTLDSLLCGNRAYEKTALMLKECQRVLKTGGFLMSISLGSPDTREMHYKREHLKMRPLLTIPFESDTGKASATNHAFICRKQQFADEYARKNWFLVLEQIQKEEAEKGYFDESSDDGDDDEDKQARLEDRYNQPLEIDFELIKKKAAELMGVPVSELPIAKAQRAAEELQKSNPAPVVHKKPASAKVVVAAAAEVVEPIKEVTPEIGGGDKAVWWKRADGVSVTAPKETNEENKEDESSKQEEISSKKPEETQE